MARYFMMVLGGTWRSWVCSLHFWHILYSWTIFNVEWKGFCNYHIIWAWVSILWQTNQRLRCIQTAPHRDSTIPNNAKMVYCWVWASTISSFVEIWYLAAMSNWVKFPQPFSCFSLFVHLCIYSHYCLRYANYWTALALFLDFAFVCHIGGHLISLARFPDSAMWVSS